MRIDPSKYFSFKVERDIIKDPATLPSKRAQQVGILALKVLSYISVVTPIVFAFTKLAETTHRINHEDSQDTNHVDVTSHFSTQNKEVAPLERDVEVVPSQEKVEAGSEEKDNEGASQQGYVKVVAPAKDGEVASPPLDVVLASPPIALEPVALSVELFDYEHPTIETVMQFASLALKNMRSFLANKLDVNANIGKNIKLVLLPLAGFGDVLFIYKACQALKQKGFKVSIDILWSMEKPGIEKIKNQLKQLDHMDDIEIILEGTDAVNAQKPDCLIFAPTIPDKEKMNMLVETHRVPFQVIYEYGGNRDFINVRRGFPHVPIRLIDDKRVLDVDAYVLDYQSRSGFGASELGIFTENGLIEPYSKDEKAKRLDELKETHFEKFSILLNGKTGLEYLNSTKLFFGYAHKKESLEGFVSVVALSNKKSTSNIDVVIPWRSHHELGEYKDKCNYHKDDLIEAGIGRVEIVKASHIVSSESISDDPALKVLRIINVFELSNPLMRELLSISEDLNLATGDQSLGELLLKRHGIPLYEPMDWKVQLNQSLLKYAENLPLVKSVLMSWKDRCEYPYIPCNELVKDILSCVNNLEESQSSKDSGPSQIELFHQSIVSKNNSLETHLCEEALRLSAIGKIPTFKEENDRLEREIKDIFKVPLFLDEFSKLLTTTLSYATLPVDINEKIILNIFIEKFEQIDKSKISEEVLEIIQRGIELFNKLCKEGRIAGDIPEISLLQTISKKLFPNIQKQLEEIKTIFT